MKAFCQILLALACLVAAGIYCVFLGLGRLVLATWDLADDFLRAAFNTELFAFFKTPRKP